MVKVEVGRVLAARHPAPMVIASQDTAAQGGRNRLRRSTARVGMAGRARGWWAPVDGRRSLDRSFCLDGHLVIESHGAS